MVIPRTPFPISLACYSSIPFVPNGGLRAHLRTRFAPCGGCARSSWRMCLRTPDDDRATELAIQEDGLENRPRGTDQGKTPGGSANSYTRGRTFPDWPLTE